MSFVEGLARQFGKEIRGISPEAARLLLAYDWPGNVRELHNAVERAVALCAYDEIQGADLPPKVQHHHPSQAVLAAVDDPAAMLPLHEIERRYVEQVMRAVGGNKATAARVLQIDRKTLYRKLKQTPDGG